MKSSSTRVWLSVIIAAVVVILVSWTIPKQVNQPKGLLLPAAKVRSPSDPNNITFYGSKPPGAQTLGLVRVEQHKSVLVAQIRQQVRNKAKKLAAQVGANGIVIKFFVSTMPGAPSAMALVIFRGEAIYSSQNL